MALKMNNNLMLGLGAASAGLSALGSMGATNKTGSALSSIGGMVGSIPTPYTAIAGAVLSAAGAVANQFTNSVNLQHVDSINSQLAGLAGTTSNATDFNTLMQDLNSLQTPDLGSLSDWGSKGLFVRESNSKRSRAMQQARDALDVARQQAQDNILNQGQLLNLNAMDLALNNFYALGGSMNNTHGGYFSNGVIGVNQGSSHEVNPLGGVPMGIAPDGQPNLVEEGEVVFNDYVFSDRIKVPDDLRKKYRLGEGISFAKAADKLSKESLERPNDPISKNGLDAFMLDLINGLEEIRMKTNTNKFACGGHKHAMGDWLYDTSWMPYAELTDYLPLGTYDDVMAGTFDGIMQKKMAEYQKGVKDNVTKINAELQSKAEQMNDTFQTLLAATAVTPQKTTTTTDKSHRYATWMRYAPVVGGAIGLATDLLKKPDYSDVDKLMAVATSNGLYQPVSYTPVGTELKLDPYDINYVVNQLRGTGASTARAITNQSNGNTGATIAGLLSNGYNTQLSEGNAYRQAQEMNNALRQTIADFYLKRDTGNSQGFLQADMANQRALMQANSQKAAALDRAIALRQNIDGARGASITANLTNLFENLGAIGQENVARNQNQMLIDAGVYGTLLDEITKGTLNRGNKKACGGSLKK